MNIKNLLPIFLIMLMISVIHATPIEEKTLSEMGYQNLTVERHEEKCFDINIPELESTNDSTFVFVLKIENYIPVNKDVIFKIYLNEKLEKTIDSKDIKQKNIIKLDHYIQKENKLKLCIENHFIPRIIISKESKIGNYLLAKIEDSDLYQIVPSKIKTNTMTPIEIVFRNRGANDAYVNVENATDRYLINNLLNHISGEYKYEGWLLAGEEKRIKYFIKTKEDLLYISPRAKLTYTNEFGEEIKIITEPLVIKAEKEKALLDIFIDLPKNITNRENTNGTIILRNNSNNDISDLYVGINSTEATEILDQYKTTIRRKEVIQIPIQIKTYDNKDFKIEYYFEYTTLDDEYKQSKITEHNIKQKQEQIFEIIGIFIILFIIIYVWFLKS